MSVRVLHLSDSHIKHQPTPGQLGLAAGVEFLRGESTLAALRQVVAGLAAQPRFDLIVHTGDLSDDGAPESLDACLAELAPLDAPMLAMPGNHDEPGLLSDAIGADASSLQIHPVGTWTVIGLCSARPGQECGTIGEEQLRELELALADTHGPVVLALHHPPVSPCSHPDCQLTDADELLTVLADQGDVRAVLSGHLHLAGHRCESGIEFLLGPSTCLQLVHTHPLAENNLASTPLGARVVELGDDGSVTSELLWW